MNIQSFHSQCIHHAHWAFDHNQYLPATVFALKPDGDVIMLSRPFDDDQDKQFMFNMYAAILEAEQVIMYCFVSEVWFYLSIDTTVTPDNAPLARDHPDKKEAVTVITSSRNDEPLFHTFEIVTHNQHKQLIDMPDFDQQIDNINLFKRLALNIDHPMVLDILKTFHDLPKPSWFNLIPKAAFNDIKADA
jgi:ribosomal protein S10